MSTLRRSSPPPRQRFTRDQVKVFTLTMDHAGADLAGGAWRGGWTYAYGPEDLRPIAGPGDVRMLHIIGDPLETRAGLRLQLGGGAEHSSERGRLLSAEEACALMPDVRLAFVQCPLIRRSERSGVDREKASYARAYAAELHAEIPIVVTVPAVPFDVGQKVLGYFARALDDWGQGNRPFADAVADARSMLISLDSEMSEAAFDLSYYGDEPL